MGYITASMKALEGKDEDWKDYWQGEDSRVYFVHGKDNIPFHTVIFPAILAGLGVKNPNLRVISSEYLKLEGKNFSSVKNWAIWADYIVENYNVDGFRYYLTLNSPEVKDTDFTWRDFINVYNRDLVNNLSSFINKILTEIEENYNSKVPKGIVSKEFKNEILNLYFDIGDYIEEGHFKNALIDIMSFIKKVNREYDSKEKNIYEALQVIVNLTNILEPFIPMTCEKLRKALNIEEPIWSYIEKKEGKIFNIDPLFEKLDRKRVSDEIKRLKEEKN